MSVSSKLFPPWYFFFPMLPCHMHRILMIYFNCLYLPLRLKVPLTSSVVKFLKCHPLWILPHVPVTPKAPLGPLNSCCKPDNTPWEASQSSGGSNWNFSRIHHFPCWLTAELRWGGRCQDQDKGSKTKENVKFNARSPQHTWHQHTQLPSK